MRPFGEEISEEDMQSVMDISNYYAMMLFDTPAAALNEASPLVREIQAELQVPYRKMTFLCGHDSDLLPILRVLGLNSEVFPDNFTVGAPIGSKIVFQHYENAEGEQFIRPFMVYPGVSQIIRGETFTLDNPPQIVPLEFQTLIPNADGMYAFRDVMAVMDQVQEDYDTLGTETETTEEIEEELDDAA